MHLANDFINKRWQDRPVLYALVLIDVEASSKKIPYPRSYGNPKVRLSELQHC